MLPPERQVDCACAPALELPILFEQTGSNQRVTACMACGKIDLIEALVDEPRPNDVRCMANVVQELDPQTRQWLAQWPRRMDDWSSTPPHYLHTHVFFSASLRCRDLDELASTKKRAYAEQEGMVYRDRLLKLGFPPEPPPQDSRHAIKSFAETWTGLTLSPDADLNTILSLSGLVFQASPFAGQDLTKREDFRNEVFRLSASNNENEWQKGFKLLDRYQMKDCEVFNILQAHLSKASVKPDPVRKDLLQCAIIVDVICNLLYSLRPESAVLAPALHALAKRVGDKDYYLRKQCLDTSERITRKT